MESAFRQPAWKEVTRFIKTDLAGESKPEEVMAFGKSHGIVINKMVAGT